MGAMIHSKQIEIIKDHLEESLSKGATLLNGQNWNKLSAEIPPLVLENTTIDMKVRKQESFGPFLVLIPFDTESEVINQANNSEYGLSASVWSRNLERAQRVASQLKTGNVSINNVMLTEANPYLPFGGIQKSGFGRFKGTFGFEAFSNIKSLLIDKDSAKLEVNWFPYTQQKHHLCSQLMKSLFANQFFKKLTFVFWGLKLDTYKPKNN
jgi:acyl-CoA reductase-like NAD-dependent aldehyde dehydrogenase